MTSSASSRGSRDYEIALQTLQDVEQKIDHSKPDETSTVKYVQQIFSRFEISISPTSLYRQVNPDPAYISEVKAVYERVILKVNTLSLKPPETRDEFKVAALRLLQEVPFRGCRSAYDEGVYESECKAIVARLFEGNNTNCIQILQFLRESHLDTDIGHEVASRLYHMFRCECAYSPQGHELKIKGVVGRELIQVIKCDGKLVEIFKQRSTLFTDTLKLFPEQEMAKTEKNAEFLSAFKTNATYNYFLINLFPIHTRLENLKVVAQIVKDLQPQQYCERRNKILNVEWASILVYFLVLPEEDRFPVLTKLQQALPIISDRKVKYGKELEFYVNALDRLSDTDYFLCHLLRIDLPLREKTFKFLKTQLVQYTSEGHVLNEAEKKDAYYVCNRYRWLGLVPEELEQELDEWLIFWDPKNWSDSISPVFNHFTEASNLFPEEKRVSLKDEKVLILALHKNAQLTIELLKMIPIEGRSSCLVWLLNIVNLMTRDYHNDPFFFEERKISPLFSYLVDLQLLPEELRIPTLDKMIEETKDQVLKSNDFVLKSPIEDPALKAKAILFLESILDKCIPAEKDFMTDDQLEEAAPLCEAVLKHLHERGWRDPVCLQQKHIYQLSLYTANTGTFSTHHVRLKVVTQNKYLITISDAQKRDLYKIEKKILNKNAAKALISEVIETGVMSITTMQKIEKESFRWSFWPGVNQDPTGLKDGVEELKPRLDNFKRYHPALSRYIIQIETQEDPFVKKSQFNNLLLFIYLSEKLEAPNLILQNSDSTPVIEQFIKIRDLKARFLITPLYWNTYLISQQAQTKV